MHKSALVVLIAALSAAVPALSQTAATQSAPAKVDTSKTFGPAAPPDTAADRSRVANLMQQRFKNADADHDGFLTRQEAQRMPLVAHHFDEIDAKHTGKVSLDEITAYVQSHQMKAQAKPADPKAGQTKADH
jgi:hypothetical protein